MPQRVIDEMADGGNRRYRITNRFEHAAPVESRRWLNLSIIATCWAYAGIATTTWVVSRWFGSEFWPVQLLCYGPRWTMALPMLVLIPLAAWRRLAIAAAGLCIAGVVSLTFAGAVLPGWMRSPDSVVSRSSLRLMTCNVQYEDLRISDLVALIRDTRPDLILLQECRLPNPEVALGLKGWHYHTEGEFCIASRFPIINFATLRRPDKAYRCFATRAEILWQGRTVPIASVHLMTPRKGLESILRSPLAGIKVFREVARVQRFESGLLRQWVADQPASSILAGDFNLTAEHPIFRRDWSGYGDAFSETSWGFGETMFTRWIGLRIDHVLNGPNWAALSCQVGPDVGSAHRPVVADLTWIGPEATESNPSTAPKR